MDGEPVEAEEVREARRLLGTEWRVDADAILEGARRLIALGPQYTDEAARRLGLVFTSNHHLGSDRRIEAARIRAGLGGDHLVGAVGALRLVVNEYRGYVEESDNIDGAYALARLAPEYMAEGAWELRRMLGGCVGRLDDWDRAYALPCLAELRGPGLMPELPDEGRDFPGHGLAREAETRWLEGWGTVEGRPDRPLWFVSHGHRTDAGATVVVSTWRPVAADRYGEHGPVEALTHARVDSLAGALHLAFPRDSDGDRAEEGFREAGRLDARRAWATRTGIGVGEGRTEFEFLPVGDAWGAVAGLGPVVIGVYGRGAAPGDLAVVPILP
ncbi:hypothetical protein ACVB8X_32490 [Streptomyces sp. NRAIS4]